MIGERDTFSLLVDKAFPESTSLFFSNDGGLPLAWNLSITANPEAVAWNISSMHGELSAGSTQEIVLSLDAAALQARSSPYTAQFTLNSSSPTPTPEPLSRAIPIVAHAIVSAAPDAQRTNVAILDVDTLAAGGDMMFTVTPFDATGMRILDSSSVAYSAWISPDFLNFTLTVGCSVSYSASSDMHEGTCRLPPNLKIGNFTFGVNDVSNTDVLVGGGTHHFPVSQCPASFSLDFNSQVCVCSAGYYASRFSRTSLCLPCDMGFYSSAGAIEQCIECVSPETSNLNRTKCSECKENYYRDDGGGECLKCPDSVACDEGSRLQDWKLHAGYWRGGPNSKNVIACEYGKAACPGGDPDRACPNQTDSWSYCGCGYAGPTCSVCAPEYHLSWAGDACEGCGDRDSHTPTIMVGILIASAFALIFGAAVAKRQKIKALASYQHAKTLYRIGAVKARILFFLCQVR